MKPRNLVSVYQGEAALESIAQPEQKDFRVLKSHEIRTLRSFCDIMCSYGCSLSVFDGYYVSYAIAQIGKEFDLLRFGNDLVLNIEIKSELKVANKIEKILKQMRMNFYYLKFLGQKIEIFTYVENDGFYWYNSETDAAIKVEAQIVATSMKAHVVNYEINPDREFVPSNYLISPFNSTEKFLNGEYFLTNAQQKIKDDISGELSCAPLTFFSISANAGTGKTLLMYDIAKEMMNAGYKIAIIHCGILNNGHIKLRDTYNWNIYAVKDISPYSVATILDGCSAVFVDETQRIRTTQLDQIILKSANSKIPIIFSYDTKQYLRDSERLDIEEYLSTNYPSITLCRKKLTTKIRTNQAMSSFIANLFKIGSVHDYLDYNCITIEYMDTQDVLKSYIHFLSQTGWTPLTFTTSTLGFDPYDLLANVTGGQNAHNVIGQEFSKVVFVMDKNFKYSDSNKLSARNSYYSAEGMLYQIVTRVVDQLKIIVLNNPELYLKLLEIKALGE